MRAPAPKEKLRGIKSKIVVIELEEEEENVIPKFTIVSAGSWKNLTIMKIKALTINVVVKGMKFFIEYLKKLVSLWIRYYLWCFCSFIFYIFNYKW